MPYQTECPSPETIAGWASGTLSDDLAEAVAEHAECCDHCEQLLARIEATSTPIERKAVAGGQGFAEEAQCREFVQAIQNVSTPRNDSKSVGGGRIRDYELLEPLGQGAMGTVYKARHTRLNKLVAIKLLNDKLSTDPSAIARFEREMDAIGRLNHPNIVQALDAGDEAGTSFLVMELLEGFDVAAIASQRKSLDVADACEIVRQAALGMAYAHSKGLIHRDLKPSNLLLTWDSHGRCLVKVLDLGLAIIDSPAAERHLTDTGQLMGTLEFMAPEQAEDTHAVDGRADIFALGATLFRLLTGSVPLDGPEYDKPVKRFKALTTTQVPSISSRRSDLPVELVAVVDKMLARDVEERPHQMAEIARCLKNFSLTNQLDGLLRTASAEHQRVSHNSQRDTGVLYGQNTDTLPEHAHKAINLTRRRLASVAGNRSLLAGVPAVLLLLFSAICLKTDGGYIQIDLADAAMQVEVEICQDGSPIDTVQVGQGTRPFWYRSGRYDVRIKSQAEDFLEVVDKDVTLTRGSEHTVVIKRVSASAERSNDALPGFVTVTTTEDDPDVPGSLRAAIASARDGDTIRFAPYLAGQSIVLNGAPLQLATNLTLDAGDLDRHVTIDGNGQSRIFDVHNRAQVLLERLTLTGGKDYAAGGGIQVSEADLTMRDCILSNNHTPTDGGGIFCHNGNVRLENCLVLDNKAEHLGGGLANYGGSCLLKNCVLTRNTSGREHGAAIVNVSAGKMELVHCTVSGNPVSGVSSHRWATLILDSCIITGNGNDKDVWIQRLDNGGVVARGANIIEHLHADVKSGPVPIIAQGMLAPLGDYGGLIPSMPPLPWSPAINAATATTATPQTDMRGFQRTTNGDTKPDMGAVELLPKDHARLNQIIRRHAAEWVFSRDGRISLPRPIANFEELGDDELRITGVEVCPLSPRDAHTLAIQLQYLPECGHLYVACTDQAAITDDTLNAFENLTQLTSLAIRSPNVTDQGLEHLIKLKELNQLALSKTNITERGLSRIGEMFPQLKSLAVESCQLVNGDLISIASMPRLERLDLNATHNPPTFIKALRDSPVSEITLRGPWQLTVDVGETLASMPQLKTVTFFLVKHDKPRRHELLQELTKSEVIETVNFHNCDCSFDEFHELQQQHPGVKIQIDGKELKLDNSQR